MTLTLKEQIKEVLKDHGPWMQAGAIFNRVDAKTKQTVVDALDAMVKAGDLVDWFGPLGGEYALPGTPPPSAASPTSTADVKPAAFRIKSGSAPADYVKPAERRAMRCTLAGDPSGAADFTTEQLDRAKADILRVADLQTYSPTELCSLLQLTRALCNTALSKLEAEHAITGEGSAERRRYRHVAEGSKPQQETPPEMPSRAEPSKAGTLQDRVVDAVRAAGPKGLTPSETHQALGGNAGSVYASLSLMYRRGALMRTKPGGAYVHADHYRPEAKDAPPPAPTAPARDRVEQLLEERPDVKVRDAAEQLQISKSAAGRHIKNARKDGDAPRFALWSDGTFTISRKQGDVVLDADETRAMCAYLDIVVTDLGELGL